MAKILFTKTKKSDELKKRARNRLGYRALLAASLVLNLALGVALWLT